MPRPPKQVALDLVPPLTEAQRAKVRKFYETDPKGGYKQALKAAGIHATKTAARAAIEADDELDDLPIRVLNVGERNALAAIGEILNDPMHKDRLRAAEAALRLVHPERYGDKARLELSGPDGGAINVEDRSSSLADVAAILKEAGALDSSGASQ